MLALVVLIVFVSDAERRIPVQYAKRQVGRKMYGGQSSHLPMKVNMSGVLPVIFAQSIATLPVTIWTFIGIPEEGTVAYSIYSAIDTQSILYMVVYFLMIIGFSYFYATIQFNPVEISNNLKKKRRIHPRLPSGLAYQPVHLQGSVQDHTVRRYLSGHCCHRASDRRQAPAYQLPCDWRNLRHHRSWCGPGDCTGAGVPDVDASVQGVP